MRNIVSEIWVLKKAHLNSTQNEIFSNLQVHDTISESKDDDILNG